MSQSSMLLQYMPMSTLFNGKSTANLRLIVMPFYKIEVLNFVPEAFASKQQANSFLHLNREQR